MLSLRNFVFLVLLIILLSPLQSVLAHGGGELQISNAPVGQYQVSVWTNPPTARAGQTIHVTVGIARISNGEPVLDAAVSVAIVNESGEPVATAKATTEQSINRLFYEADLAGVSVGMYEMHIEVTGSDGSGLLSFALPVEAVPIWPWLVGAAGVGGVFWLVLRYWRSRATGAVSRRGKTRTEPVEAAVSRSRSVD